MRCDTVELVSDLGHLGHRWQLVKRCCLAGALQKKRLKVGLRVDRVDPEDALVRILTASASGATRHAPLWFFQLIWPLYTHLLALHFLVATVDAHDNFLGSLPSIQLQTGIHKAKLD